MTFTLSWEIPQPLLALTWLAPAFTMPVNGSPGCVPIMAAVVGPPGLNGPPGPQGPPGTPGQTVSAQGVTVATGVVAGQPLTINRTTGQAFPADNRNKLTSFVLGVAQYDAETGFATDIVAGGVTLPDWSAVAGSSLLKPGSVYFLGLEGTISSNVPTAPGILTIVGVAGSTTTLDVAPSPPLQL
jgi:hypothetical protein